jgi:hypothetical protein
MPMCVIFMNHMSTVWLCFWRRTRMNVTVELWVRLQRNQIGRTNASFALTIGSPTT